MIDTGPIGTVDFNLQPIEKTLLLEVGRASALKFLQRRNLDDGPDATTVESACREAESCRDAARRMRKSRLIRRIIVPVLLLAFVYAIGPLVWRAFLEAWSYLRRIP